MDNPVIKALIGVLSAIPASREPRSGDPAARAKAIVDGAALKAAGLSGSLSALPGPAGLLTVVPDLLAIWKLQSQMIADIAHVFGKEATLTREMMLYCLFRHGGSALVRDVATRVGERLLLRKPALSVFQQALTRIGLNITQKALGKGLARWVPLIGAAGMAGYAYYDTRKVGATAIAAFSTEIVVLEGGADVPLLEDMGATEVLDTE